MDGSLILCESASIAGSSPVSTQASTPLATMADMVHAYTVMDRDTYQQAVGVLTAQIKAVDKSVSLQCGALRLASGSSARSGSASGSSGVASKPFGGRNAKLDSIKRAASWRKAVLPRGMCYSKMLKDSSAESVVNSLGEWPTVAALLRLPASNFKSIDDLQKFRLQGDAGSVHVVDSGFEGTSMLPSIARVAQGLRTSPGTFGAVLRASAVPGDAAAVRLGARTMVGGEVQVASGVPVSGLPFGSSGACGEARAVVGGLSRSPSVASTDSTVSFLGEGFPVSDGKSSSAGWDAGVLACEFTFGGLSRHDFSAEIAGWMSDAEGAFGSHPFAKRVVYSYATSRILVLYSFLSYDDALTAVSLCPAAGEEVGGEFGLVSVDAYRGYSAVSSTPDYPFGATGLVALRYGPGGYDAEAMQTRVDSLVAECAVLGLPVQSAFSYLPDGRCVLYVMVGGSVPSLLQTSSFRQLRALATVTGSCGLSVYDSFLH